MARGKYTETDQIRRLRRLVAFANADNHDASAAAAAGSGMLIPATAEAFKRLSVGGSRALQRKLREFLLAAAGAPLKDGYLSATRFSIEILPLVGTLRQTKGPHYAIGGKPSAVLLHQAMTVLDGVGDDRVRVCPAADCGRLFVKIGRREYCTPLCQQHVYFPGYVPPAVRARRAFQQKRKRS